MIWQQHMPEWPGVKNGAENVLGESRDRSSNCHLDFLTYASGFAMQNST